MSFEMLGVDVSNPEYREQVFDVYTFWKKNGAETDLVEDYEAIADWIEYEPDMAKEFLHSCVSHDSPQVRGLGGMIADLWFKSDPDLAIGIMVATLNDDDEIVQNRVSGYYYDILTDTGPELLDQIGLNRFHTLLSALQNSVTKYE